ncbi:MAG: hypothetical protein HQL32_00425 [Planctomycetes bacterium]|nr:hypothetical protein [Planctomycetota bacterium]
MSDNKVSNIAEVRPPNPYDFSSICEFLETVLGIEGFVSEYPRVISLVEARENERLGEDEGRKQKLNIKVFDEDQFEAALIRAFFMISSSLISFKQKSPREQEVKREFLAKDNLGNLKNALTTAGFPEGLGRAILSQKQQDLMSYKISKALIKGHVVFDRAFYFTVKENELTKKSIDELVEMVRAFEMADDLRQYLETLLYKVEVTSTEKSFLGMKKKVAEPMEVILKAAKAEKENLSTDPRVSEKGSEMEAKYLGVCSKVEILSEYCEEYFSNADFIFVEKNLLQFSKSKAVEQIDRNNKPLLSDEFSATIERKLMIQLISAFKKVYNINELWLLKHYLLADLVRVDPTENDQAMAKFMAKKKILMDALKRIRMDMIVEDTFNTASENKKNFIESFEKELLRLSPKQYTSQLIPLAEKKSSDIVSRAKRVLAKKSDAANQDKEEALAFQESVDQIGQQTVRLIMEMYKFCQCKVSVNKLQAYMPVLDPKLKALEVCVKRMEKGPEQIKKKNLIKRYLTAFMTKAAADSLLDAPEKRVFLIYIKGLIDRVDYW